MQVGDLVCFGRPGGEKTAGRIVRVSARTAGVRSLECRGAKPPGTVFSVPLGQVAAIDESKLFEAEDGELFLDL